MCEGVSTIFSSRATISSGRQFYCNFPSHMHLLRLLFLRASVPEVRQKEGTSQSSQGIIDEIEMETNGNQTGITE